jgi:hypothetical protein
LVCTEWPRRPADPARTQVFRNLAKQSLKLAVDLERAHLLGERELKPRKH